MMVKHEIIFQAAYNKNIKCSVFTDGLLELYMWIAHVCLTSSSGRCAIV